MIKTIVLFITVISMCINFIACDSNNTVNLVGVQHEFNEKKILPLYEKEPWTPGPKHGDALVGNLKYKQGFAHFDYVNPNAPVGGTLVLSSQLSFDSFNPVTIKGTTPDGIDLLFETLMTSSLDEPASMYGLIAETIEYPMDKSRVTFVIRKEAKWHDGKPITVDDVIYSFNVQRKNMPLTAQYYKDVQEVKKTADRQVTFFLKPGSNPELPHILGQLTVIPKHYFEKRNTNDIFLEPPLGSGQYTIKEFDLGRSITYERNPDYWGWDLAVNKGMYNFQTIQYKVYLDPEVMFQAFKAGEFDFRDENTASKWATEYNSLQFTDGSFKRELIADDSPVGMQALAFNIRRDLFTNAKVREGFSYLFDFEFTNKQIFYNMYKRTKSFYENSVFASYLGGLPGDDELKYLNPFKNQIPPEVFTKVYEPPKTDGSGNIRQNMKTALAFFNEAGWEIKDGKLVDKNGNQMKFEILIYDQGAARILESFIENLKKAGIDAGYRQIDYTHWISQVQKFDYDMISFLFGQSFSPGNEQRYYWGSSEADVNGSRNFIGIKNPVVDSLIESVISAPNFQELKAATRALDRVLLWNHYVIPEWHINYYRIAYKNKFGQPDTSGIPLFVVQYNYVCILTWWEDPEKTKQ
ncbi:MAG: ABC transporter substrate-binding protein [Spirochaetales bacterium]|nr:ABC transporter substrate-binding protein [Spirochaetales bacterium]